MQKESLARLVVVTSMLLACGSTSAVETDLFGPERERLKPKCDVLTINGVVADSFGSLENLSAAKNKAAIIARDELHCSPQQCYGFAQLHNARAYLQNWTQNYLYVTTSIEFENGRRMVYLWVNRKNATCR